jgi:hypothetical protein
MPSHTHQNGSSKRNANHWRQVAVFLDVQFLASLGLGPVVVKSAASVRLSESEAASRTMQREAHPVGNTGITSNLRGGK